MFGDRHTATNPIRSRIRAFAPRFVKGLLADVAEVIAHHHGVKITKTTQTTTRTTYHTNNGTIHLTPSQDGFYGRFVAGLKGTVAYYKVIPHKYLGQEGFVVSGNGSMNSTLPALW